MFDEGVLWGAVAVWMAGFVTVVLRESENGIELPMPGLVHIPNPVNRRRTLGSYLNPANPQCSLVGMTLLIQMLDHFRSLITETEEEIQLMEAGKLHVIRQGQDYSQIRLEELRLRRAKLIETIGKFG